MSPIRFKIVGTDSVPSLFAVSPTPPCQLSPFEIQASRSGSNGAADIPVIAPVSGCASRSPNRPFPSAAIPVFSLPHPPSVIVSKIPTAVNSAAVRTAFPPPRICTAAFFFPDKIIPALTSTRAAKTRTLNASLLSPRNSAESSTPSTGFMKPRIVIRLTSLYFSRIPQSV